MDNQIDELMNGQIDRQIDTQIGGYLYYVYIQVDRQIDKDGNMFQEYIQMDCNRTMDYYIYILYICGQKHRQTVTNRQRDRQTNVQRFQWQMEQINSIISFAPMQRSRQIGNEIGRQPAKLANTKKMGYRYKPKLIRHQKWNALW